MSERHVVTIKRKDKGEFHLIRPRFDRDGKPGSSVSVISADLGVFSTTLDSILILYKNDLGLPIERVKRRLQINSENPQVEVSYSFRTSK